MWILQSNYTVEGLHYLDDFLLEGQDHSHNSVQAMLALCSNLGGPVAMDKLENPASTLTFLGITVNQELRQPAEKLRQILPTVTNWLGCRTAPQSELHSLIGMLAFAAQVVPAGCLFCWWLFQLSLLIEKLHHHIFMNAEAREDLQWWHPSLIRPRRAVERWLSRLVIQAIVPSTRSTYRWVLLSSRHFANSSTCSPAQPANMLQLCLQPIKVRLLRIQIITVYPAAISYLRHSNGFQSAVTRNPKLRLAL